MAKPLPAPIQPPGIFQRAIIPCMLLGLTILLIFAARVRLLSAPLERDEGEYAYMGQLMLEGIPPYAVAANMKLPGTSAVYALVMAVFGQSITAIHIGLLLANALTVWLIYLLGRRLFNPAAGLASAAAYAVLSSGWSVLGIWAHATHFLVLPAVAGTLLLLRWDDSQRIQLLAWSGILFGLSILMKQHGALFAAFGLIYVLNGRRWREAGVFSLMVALPFALMMAILWRLGVAEKFWFWTFAYASEYATATPLSAGLQTLVESLHHITLANWAVWLLAFAGLLLLGRQKHFFILSLLLTSFLAICPGFYFREHYFILMLPAVALCAGAATTWKPSWTLWGAAAILLFSVFEQRDFLFRMEPGSVTAAVYGGNPFPEALEVSEYIKKNAVKDDKIAVLGSEPEIFFYTQRHSATPYIYTYPLMESHPFARKMQDDFIRDIEAAKPRYAVLVNVATSWLRAPDSHTAVFEWWAKYGALNYEQVGVADIFPQGSTYLWDNAAAAYRPRSASHLLVLRRRQ